MRSRSNKVAKHFRSERVQVRRRLNSVISSSSCSLSQQPRVRIPNGTSSTRGTSQPALVCIGRHARLLAPPAHPADGHAARGVSRQAGRRHPQHLERPEPLPRAFARARGGGQTGNLAGGRLPGRVAGPVGRRGDGEADHHALSQPARHGGGGNSAFASGRWRGASRRLRQVHARAPDGCDQHGYPGDLLSGRTHVERAVARSKNGRRDAYQEVLGRASGRQHIAAGLGRPRESHDAFHRHLQHHGYGFHDDVHRRCHGPDPSRSIVDSRRRQWSHAHGVGLRRSHRRDDLGRSQAVADHRCEELPKRPCRLYGARRLDQCRRPPRRHGAPGRRPSEPGRHVGDGRQGPGLRQSLPIWRISDGGLLFRGRPFGLAKKARSRISIPMR